MKKRILIIITIFVAFLLVSCNVNEPDLVKLDIPVITKQSDNKIGWTEVENAVGYDLDVDGSVRSLATNSFEVSEHGTYVFKVRAKADGDSNFLNSDWSQEFTLVYEAEISKTKLASPIIDKEDHTTIYWLPVANAIGYQVYINGTAVTPTLASTVTSYSIEGKDFGLYTLTVIALANVESNFENSNLSNAIELELINTDDYEGRLEITVTGKPEVIKGESATYNVEISDRDGADVSFLLDDLVFSVEQAPANTAINNQGVLTTENVGSVKIVVSLGEYPNIKSDLTVSVIERPTFSVSLPVYDKSINNNKAGLDVDFDGKIHYLNLPTAPTLEQFFTLTPFNTNVLKTDDEFVIDFGKPEGSKVDVYFVFEYLKDGYSIGYSDVFSLTDIEMLVEKVNVSNQAELKAALDDNKEHITLTNDITMTEPWSRVNTVFTGTLDGANFTIKDLIVEGGGSGLIRTLGDGATFINIIFDNPIAREFSGANNGIIASTVLAGSKVIFENFAIVNGQSISSVDGSGRSTHAALIANFSDPNDTELSVRLTNVYLEYTHRITRATDTANIGVIFGNFVSNSLDGIILENVYINYSLISNTHRANNTAALYGQGRGHVTVNNSVIIFNFDSPAGGVKGLDVGYFNEGFDATFTGSNNVFISPTETLNGTWPEGSHKFTKLGLLLGLEPYQDLNTHDNSFWILENDNLSVKVANELFQVLIGEQLSKPSLVVEGNIISWDAIENASGYQVYVDGQKHGEAITNTQFNYGMLDANTYQIQIVSLGNQAYYLDSLLSDAVSVTIQPFDRLLTPVLSQENHIVSWNEDANAVSYKLFLNDVEIASSLTTNSFDLSTHLTKGYFKVEVQAIANPQTHLDSFISSPLEIIIEVKVADAVELRTALVNNEYYIRLTNDITLTGVWSQVTTIFTGTLDGDGYEIKDLIVEGGNTGLLRTLGNGATFKNITFDGATARNFSGANDGIIANTVVKGAKVTFENFALINAQSLSSVAGSSRSTHGALIATYNDITDVEISIRLTKVYIDYTHHVSRETDTANVGGLFGTFVAASENAIILDQVSLNIKLISDTAGINNGGAIFGQGTGHIAINDSFIRFVYDSAKEGPNGFEGGLFVAAMVPVFSGSNNIFISSKAQLKAIWDETNIFLPIAAQLEANQKEGFAQDNDAWVYEDLTLKIEVNGDKYQIFAEEQLEAPTLVLDGYVIRWNLIPNAIGYILYEGEEALTQLLVNNSFDIFELAPGTHQISIKAIGNNYAYYESLQSANLEVVVPANEQLEAPVVLETEYLLTWDVIPNAIGYKIYLNGVVIEENITANNYDLTASIELGLYLVQVQALANLDTHLPSELSNVIEIINAVEVSDALSLKAALDSNQQYIKLTNDIVLEGVWTRVATVFTGTLDGDGYAIKDLIVQGGNTGMFRTLGNGATFKNITFDGATAQNFSGASNAIIASEVEAGSIITFENFALINAQSLSSVDGSGRSTHSALIASINNVNDTTISIRLYSVYIQYTHHISRTTTTANVGGLFGNFVTNSQNALIMNNVYLDINILSDLATINNVGSIFGTGSGGITMNNTIIKYDFSAPASSQSGFDGGFFNTNATTNFSGENNLFIGDSAPIKGNWTVDAYELYPEIDNDDLADIWAIFEEANSWYLFEGNIYLEVNNNEYALFS